MGRGRGGDKANETVNQVKVEITYADGGSFKGNWDPDSRLRCGEGCTRTYADGSRFEGDYKLGYQHGKGKMTYPDARVYDGNFEKGAPSTGKLTPPYPLRLQPFFPPPGTSRRAA